MRSSPRLVRTISVSLPWIFKDAATLRIANGESSLPKFGEPVSSANIVLGEGDSVRIELAMGRTHLGSHTVRLQEGSVYYENRHILPVIGYRPTFDPEPVVVPSCFARKEKVGY